MTRTRESAGLPLYWCALGALLTGLAACDLSPRTPEDPGGIVDTTIVNLSDPSLVLYQIRVGLASGRINSYMNAFTQDFTFNPDDRDSLTLVQQKPEVFDNWTFDVEQQVAQIIFADYSQRDVTFVTAESTVVAPDIVVLDEDYNLLVDSERYQGRAELQMLLVGNEWRIFKWIDRRQADADSSWSLLKGQSRP